MFKSALPVGLDITPTSLTAVSLRKRGRVYAVDQFAVAPLAPGIVVDGEVADIDALAQALRAFWEAEKITSHSVALGVANQRCIVRLIDLPMIKKRRDLEDAVRFEAQDHLPIPIDEAVVDFHGLEEFESENGMRKRIVLVAAYREMVQRYQDAFSKAGLKLERIDLAAFALMRAGLGNASAFAALHGDGDDQKADALCDIGPAATNVVIAAQGVCESTRLISFGTNAFTQTLADHFQWSFEDASRVKFEAGILPQGGIESPGDAYTQSRQVLQHVVDELGGQIRNTLDYFVHSQNREIRRVVLSGEGALLRGIEQRLANELRLPVSILDASPRLDPKSVDRIGLNHAHMAVALGLGMQEAAA